jgi:signal transduction histidine kinase
LAITTKRRFADLRLATKLLALFALVSALPLAVSGAYVVGSLEADSRARARAALADGLAKIDLVVGKRWAEIERLSRTTARDNLVTINLDLSLDNPVRDYLGSMAATQSLSVLGIAGPEGRARIEGGERGGLSSLADALGPRFFGRAAGQGGLRFAAKVPGARAPRLVVGAAVPVLGGRNELLGFVVAGDEISERGTLLAELRSTVGSPVLVECDGLPSAYSEAEPSTVVLDDEGPAGGEGRRRFFVDDLPYRSRFRAFDDPERRPAGLVGLGLRESYLMDERNRALASFVLVLLGALGVSVAFSLLFSRSVTRPLDEMLEATGRMVGGDFAISLPIRSEDEIGSLAREFNRMSRRLGSSLASLKEEVGVRVEAEAEVQKLNRELEARIEARTAELSEANRELEATVRNLEAARSQLVEAEKLAALGQLVASIAHEINTPLAAILSSAGNAGAYLGELLSGLPDAVAAFGARERGALRLLASAALRPLPLEAVDADRARTRELEETLRGAGVAGSRDAAEELLGIDAAELGPDILAVLAGPSGPAIIGLAGKLGWVFRDYEIISAAAEKAARTIRALKSYVREDRSGEATVFDPAESVGSVLALYYARTAGSAEIRTEFEPAPRVRGRRDDLDQVWVNLIDNALQAMEYRGELGISVGTAPGGFARVSFADGGPGIPAETGDKVFRPFFSTKRSGEGSGLGLSICKRTVEELGGSISFESRPGRTVFTVLLPGA